MTSLRSAPIGAPQPARLTDADLPPLDLTIPPWPGRPVDLGAGVGAVYVRETPGGPAAEPAVCVHGLGGASSNWTDFGAQLAPWLAAQALDLPGFGQSPPARRYTIRAHADVVAALIERSGRGPVHLVGNSMGGAIAISVATRRPDLIRTLTLISPAVPNLDLRRKHGGVLPLVAVPGLGALLMRYVNRVTPEERVRGVLDLCFADPSVVPENRLAEAAEEIRARAGLPWASSAFARSLRGLIVDYLRPDARNMWRALHTITAPTLVIWGKQDRLVDAVLAPRVAAAVPNSRLLLLDDIGHVAQMEQPVTSARAVVALLEDTARETAR